MASVTNIEHKPNQISIRESDSEGGIFSLALAEILISMRSVVIKIEILPGTRPGGIEKLIGGNFLQLISQHSSIHKNLPDPRYDDTKCCGNVYVGNEGQNMSFQVDIKS